MRHQFSLAIKESPSVYQKGVTLIELLVGIAIGLMTIAVAMGALIASRGVSGTISDASQIQQQASYAFRVMGQQLRQAGSLRLNLAPQKAVTDPIDISDPVAFETKTADFDPASNSISGKDTPGTGEYKLVTGFRNYTEAVFPSGAQKSLFRDCLGEEDSAKPTLIESRFILDNTTHELRCNNQALIRNVADFQIQYLVQANAASGTPTIQYVNAATASTDPKNIYGIEVCIVLYGDESIQTPDGSTYTGCDGNPVNMSNTGSLPINRKNRLHMIFKSVYQLRSQGLVG